MTMTAPTMQTKIISETSRDYDEFESRPVEFWKAHRKKHGSIPQTIDDAQRKMLTRWIPDEALHQDVAMIGRSTHDNRLTLLTTSGQMIQFAHNPARHTGVIIMPRDIDAKGIALVMEHDRKLGCHFTPETIPFGAGADEAFKTHVRKVWAEVQHQQQREAKPDTTASARPAPAAAAGVRMTVGMTARAATP